MYRPACFALASLTLVAACSRETSGALGPVKTTPAAFLTSLDALRAETYVGKGKETAAADVASIVAALPAGVDIKWDTLTFDEASHATILSNVRITPDEMPEVGVSIATAKLWGLDADFAKARLTGQRLDESARLAERIDLSGISAFGLDQLMAPMMDSYNDAMISTIEGVIDDEAIAGQIEIPATTFENYTLGLDRFIAHDLHLRAWELTPANLSADNAWAESLPALQQMTALYRAFAADTIAAFDMNATMSMTQPTGAFSLDYSVERSAVRGMRGYDVDLATTRGMAISMDVPIPQPPVFDDEGELVVSTEPAPSMQMAFTVDGADHANLRLDRAASYLARGQMPPRTETDLLSLGEISLDNMSISTGDQRLYAIGSMKLKADDFHWLIPASVRLDVKDYLLDLAGMTGFVQRAAEMEGPTAPDAAEVSAIIARLLPVLERHGFSELSSNYSMGWNWNPKSGLIKADYSSKDPELVSIALNAEGDLPSFDAVSKLIPANPTAADETAVQQLFSRVSALRSAKAELVDHGGIEKVFALAADLLKTFRTELPPEMQTFADRTPQNLRQMTVSGMYLVADTAGQEDPLARDMLRPIAAWLDKGGRVEWRMAPATPVTAAVIESAPADSAAVAKRLGLSATHTPPN